MASVVSPQGSSRQYEKLLQLALQRAIDGRGGLAASVAELCLSAKSDLSPRELDLAFDIIRMLVDKVEVRIRRHIAEYLAARQDVPPDLVRFLANDHITVAYPVLVNSRLLDDEELVEIVANRTKQHRLAVAARGELSPRVCGTLVASGEADVVKALLNNAGARFAPDTIEGLVDASRDVAAYRAPLLRRHEMTDRLAERMYAWVGEALRAHIVRHFAVEPAVVAVAVESAVATARAEEGPAARSRDAGLRAAAVHATAVGVAAEAFFAALAADDWPWIEGRLREITGLDEATIAHMLYGSDQKSLAVLGRTANFPDSLFERFLHKLFDLGDGPLSRRAPNRG